jgi:hypothetical protein
MLRTPSTLDQIVIGDEKAVFASRVEQINDGHPATRLKSQSNFVRGVAQVLRQVLDQPNEAIFHGSDSKSLAPIQSS